VNPRFRVSNGLLSPEHVTCIGSALWVFLLLIDMQTSKSGAVNGGAPLRVGVIAERLGLSKRTVERSIATLRGKNQDKREYVKAKRTPYGLVFHIASPKKFRPDNSGASGTGDPTDVSTENRQKRRNDPPDMAETKNTGKQEYPSWFEKFWSRYPSSKGSKKSAFEKARKVLRCHTDVDLALSYLSIRAKHIAAMKANGKFVESLPHVERYFSRGLWNQEPESPADDGDEIRMAWQ
jgi:hypothetical protein